jgi:excisionase family DNA binding protein
VPVSTVYRLAQQRQLPGRKVGRQWRFSRPLLDAWLMSPEHRHDGAGHDDAFQLARRRAATPAAAEATGAGVGVGPPGATPAADTTWHTPAESLTGSPLFGPIGCV